MPEELSLITPVNDNFRRDVELADTTLTDPNEADALFMGEWLAPDGAGTHKWVRAVAGVRGAKQIFSPKGDMATQALGKVAVIQLHAYEAETYQLSVISSPAPSSPSMVWRRFTVAFARRRSLVMSSTES
jgi:hypothetical protein